MVQFLQPFLRPPALGDVTRPDDGPGENASLVEDRVGNRFQPEVVSLRVPVAVIDLYRLGSSHSRHEPGGDAFHVVRVDEIQYRAAQQLTGFVSQVIMVRGPDVFEDPFRAHLADHVHHVVGDAPQPLFALPQGLFRTLAIGYLAGVYDHPGHRRIIQEVLAERLDAAPFPVPGPDAILRGNRIAGFLDPFPEDVAHALQVVRVEEVEGADHLADGSRSRARRRGWHSGCGLPGRGPG